MKQLIFALLLSAPAFAALPGSSISRMYQGYTLTVFVCHSDPVIEVDLFIRDANDRPIGQTISHIGHDYLNLYTGIALDGNNILELSLTCVKK